MGKQRYFWDEEKIQILRDNYDGTVMNRAREVARAIGFPRYSITRMAQELGLSRVKERPWSNAETDYLGSHFHKARVGSLAKHLGRSVTAVKLKAKRLGYRKKGEGYTACGLAMALGEEAHWVTRRIKRGMIKASYRMTERGLEQGGDIFLITEDSVVAFIKAHIHQINLRKVDPLWFLDLVHHQLALVPSRNGHRNGDGLEHQSSAREESYEDEG